MRELVRSSERLARKGNILLKKEQSRRKITKQTPQNKIRTPRSMPVFAKYQQAWNIKENQYLLLPFSLAKFIVNPERNSILIS